MELGEPDASGRRSPKPIRGSEFTVAGVGSFFCPLPARGGLMAALAAPLVLGHLYMALLAWLFPDPTRVRGILTGFAAAWAASSVSVAR